MNDKQTLFDRLAPLLDRPKRGYDGRLFSFCPCHQDGAKHANAPQKGLAGRSLSLHPTIGLTCFAGCKFEDILAALERGGGRLPAPSRNGKAPSERTVAIYDYEKPDGTLVARKHRIEGPDGKRFLWYLPGADKPGDVPPMREMPLYGVAALTPENLVQPCYFAEGEKAMEALNAHKLLAVCAGGGSGQQDFGDGLKVLAGRHVRLWPDNDAVGRAYMELLALQLKGIAASVSFVMPPIPLPVKGDAYDYFELGGTAAALEAQQGPTQPITEITGEDAVRVMIPTAGGPVRFDFAEIAPSTHRLEAQVTVTYGKDEPYRVRRNLLSGSERTDLRRSLENMYGKDIPWERCLNTAYNHSQDVWKQQDLSQDPASVPPQRSVEQYDVPPLLPKSGLTIWFGDGDSGKTYVIQGLTLAYVLGLQFANFPTPGRNIIFLDYEDSIETFSYRLDRLRRGWGLGATPVGRIHYLPGRGVPIPQQVERIRRKTATCNAGRLIVDSLNVGCGGDPKDPEVATACCRAFQQIGLPTLAIAHITKGDSNDGPFARKPDTHKPFGSVVWHNSARRTWWVNRSQDDAPHELTLALVCRKANNGPRPDPIPLRLSFQDPDGAVILRRADFAGNMALAETSLRLSDRIKQALANGGLSVADIVLALGMENTKANNEKVRVTLVRAGAKQPPEFVRDGNTWTLPGYVV